MVLSDVDIILHASAEMRLLPMLRDARRVGVCSSSRWTTAPREAAPRRVELAAYAEGVGARNDDESSEKHVKKAAMAATRRG